MRFGCVTICSCRQRKKIETPIYPPCAYKPAIAWLQVLSNESKAPWGLRPLGRGHAAGNRQPFALSSSIVSTAPALGPIATKTETQPHSRAEKCITARPGSGTEGKPLEKNINGTTVSAVVSGRDIVDIDEGRIVLARCRVRMRGPITD